HDLRADALEEGGDLVGGDLAVHRERLRREVEGLVELGGRRLDEVAVEHPAGGRVERAELLRAGGGELPADHVLAVMRHGQSLTCRVSRAPRPAPRPGSGRPGAGEHRKSAAAPWGTFSALRSQVSSPPAAPSGAAPPLPGRGRDTPPGRGPSPTRSGPSRPAEAGPSSAPPSGRATGAAARRCPASPPGCASSSPRPSRTGRRPSCRCEVSPPRSGGRRSG